MYPKIKCIWPFLIDTWHPSKTPKQKTNHAFVKYFFRQDTALKFGPEKDTLSSKLINISFAN